MARVEPKTKRGIALQTPSPSSWRTVARMVLEARRQTPFVRRSSSSEAQQPASALAEAWLLLEARGEISLAVVQPGYNKVVEAIPRRTEISNQLARKIC